MNILCLMRHGETDANKKLIVQGRINNPLNQVGENQAWQTGMFLVKTKESFDMIVSSPLKRAHNTAKIIAGVIGKDQQVLIWPELTERDFGDFDGRVIDNEYAKRVVFDEIPNMEKNHDLETRIFNALTSLCNAFPNQKILVVAHSHVIKAILVKILPGFTYTSYLFNCSLNYLKYEDGIFTVISHNINPLI
ncbi:MAG: histidine phosphatase family protein [Candidatus Izemoplasmatales bacterium]|nr:histidine phosphatase family protein [Candidatus Izemoplasmatales bacterium]MDD4595806.1 histidine phosphatase family protein [Candidatus Izemoplasmatales bacterium]